MDIKYLTNIVNLDSVWDEFIKREFVVNCITKEDSDIFLNYCFSKNIYWGDGIEELEQWEWLEEETCYSVYKNRLQYSDIDTEKRIIIFSTEMIDNKEK